eukprot:Lithocolla_globosa_v1_NODE_13_length_10672_cov_64.188000.p9 type:complete len:150 gc:universal NODE_13_length_10672_cov_64.188000:1338-889(-)
MSSKCFGAIGSTIEQSTPKSPTGPARVPGELSITVANLQSVAHLNCNFQGAMFGETRLKQLGRVMEAVVLDVAEQVAPNAPEIALQALADRQGATPQTNSSNTLVSSFAAAVIMENRPLQIQLLSIEALDRTYDGDFFFFLVHNLSAWS